MAAKPPKRPTNSGRAQWEKTHSQGERIPSQGAGRKPPVSKKGKKK